METDCQKNSTSLISLSPVEAAPNHPWLNLKKLNKFGCGSSWITKKLQACGKGNIHHGANTFSSIAN